jgi:hypothetical protein
VVQIVVFEMAVLIGLAGHFSQVPFIRASGWALMVIFIGMGIAQGAAFPPATMP